MQVITKWKHIPFVIGASILGLVSVVIPPMILSEVKQYDHPIWPAVVTGIEGVSFLTIVFLGLSGMALGLISPNRYCMWSAVTMAPFPLFTIVDGLFSLAPHQLLPFEFFMYAVLAMPAVIGHLIGAFIMYWFSPAGSIKYPL